MGNKLCKKKTDVEDNPKAPTPFDRIINRLHLRPNSWKSDSYLNQKKANRCKLDRNKSNENVTHTKLLSKSSDWTDVALEVPEKEDGVHLRNPKLSLIFNNDNTTPTPPPRKHKKGIREKIEAVAKNSLQSFQSKKPVEEPPCVKKTVKATCPDDYHVCAIHHKKADRKQEKRRKNLSVISLPNYSELTLAVANFDDIDKKPDDDSSQTSLPTTKKLTTVSTGKLETCMTRCRSFGSLLPQQLLDKLRVKKIPAGDESDDSFGALEDWDLRIIEHYNPKDASLPRTIRVAKTQKDVLSDVENLIVQDENEEKSTVKSQGVLNCVNSKRTVNAVGVTPPPSPEPDSMEHSSLMKILQEYSMRDKQQSNKNSVAADDATLQNTVLSVEDFLNNEKSNGCREIQHAKLGSLNTAKT